MQLRGTSRLPKPSSRHFRSIVPWDSAGKRHVSDTRHKIDIYKLECAIVLALRRSITNAEIEIAMMFWLKRCRKPCMNFVVIALPAPPGVYQEHGKRECVLRKKGRRTGRKRGVVAEREVEVGFIIGFNWLGLAVAKGMESIALEAGPSDIVVPMLLLKTVWYSALKVKMVKCTLSQLIWKSILLVWPCCYGS